MSGREDNTPLGWQGSGPDFELSGTGPYHWEAYDEELLIGKGKARTRFGAYLQMQRWLKKWRKQETRPTSH